MKNSLSLSCRIFFHEFDVGLNHFFDQLFEGDFRFPMKFFFGFFRISDQKILWKLKKKTIGKLNRKRKKKRFFLVGKLTTSVGRKYFGLTVIRTIPVSFSFPTSSTPSPCQLKNKEKGHFSSRRETNLKAIVITWYFSRFLEMQLQRILERCEFHLEPRTQKKVKENENNFLFGTCRNDKIFGCFLLQH